ncbi:MAG: septum formation initiator [Sphingomonadales bacterium]|nr:septum formation initiator [Sphingomonadales bacterium]
MRKRQKPGRAGKSAPKVARENLVQVFALAALLVMAGLAVAGPSGVLAWEENHRLLVERKHEITALTHDRDVLRNRVALLDPRHVDPDLAGELLRSRLNVVHPDEMVLLLPR